MFKVILIMSSCLLAGGRKHGKGIKRIKLLKGIYSSTAMQCTKKE
jgi:hypothetical protein